MPFGTGFEYIKLNSVNNICIYNNCYYIYIKFKTYDYGKICFSLRRYQRTR